jgi:MoxR-like ATPase
MTTDTVKKLTKSQDVATDIAALLRARNPLLWIVTKEEQRVELYLFEALKNAGYELRTWDAAQGIIKGSLTGEPKQPETSDINTALDVIRADAKASAGPNAKRGAWILRDLPPWLDGLIGLKTVRQLRNLSKMLPGVDSPTAQAMIVLSPSGKVPPELEGHATVIEWPLPDRAEISMLLDAQINGLRDNLKAGALPKGMREPAIEAALGLSGEEVQACFARSMVQYKKIDPVAVAREKKRVVAREGVLEWYDPLPGGLDAVGGLENLKAWLNQRKMAYSPAARAYGLRAPKGALLVGVPGCGKSLTAKAIATAWDYPLLRIDLGGLKGKFVGESEGNLRRAIAVIEAIGRCIVWIDEIEKALAGATQGAADGGVSADALGTILSWMQERRGESFVIATANDVTALPPELMRKGRFDDVWFVDLPNEQERRDILKASLKANGRDKAAIKLSQVAASTNGFTGVEISELVPSAMFEAFADDEREITTSDILKVAKDVAPLSKTAGDRIQKLRDWAKGKARNATATTAEREQTSTSRQIDIDEETEA